MIHQIISWCARVGRRHGRLSTTSTSGEENQESLSKWKQRRMEPNTEYSRWLQTPPSTILQKHWKEDKHSAENTVFSQTNFQWPVTAVESLNDSIQPSLMTLNLISSVAGELCKLARVTGPEFPHPFSPVGCCLPATGRCCAVRYKRQCLPGFCTMCWKVLVNPYPSNLHAEKCVTLPLLRGLGAEKC